MTATMTAEQLWTFDELALDFERGVELEYERWLELLETLAGIEHGRQWWIGDALVEGEKRFSEELFYQGAERLRLAPHTMQNHRSVASAVTKPRRRAELSWSHHAEVARLRPAEQRAMLAEAVERKLTVRELRDVVAAKFPRDRQESLIDRSPASAATDLEQRTILRRVDELEQRFREWQDRGGSSDELGAFVGLDDITWLLRTCRGLAMRAA